MMDDVAVNMSSGAVSTAPLSIMRPCVAGVIVSTLPLRLRVPPIRRLWAPMASSALAWIPVKPVGAVSPGARMSRFEATMSTCPPRPPAGLVKSPKPLLDGKDRPSETLITSSPASCGR